MADQKALKKRLKVLMTRPENQVCSDCPERQPRWASLVVPPPGAPPNSLPIGAFCCLECSGSHRRLGVHISFVRSINLDSWKEKEVLAMENGGNARVNAIFEARLPAHGNTKPTQLADGRTRERFIRDKYERRKYYDPSGFSATVAAVEQAPAPKAAATSVGAPSDAAKKRMEQRRARKAVSGVEAATAAPPPRSTARKAVAAAPVSAPVDLLDLTGAAAASSPAPTAANNSSSDLGSFFQVAQPAPATRETSTAAQAAGPDIMSLYNNNTQLQQQPQSFANFGDFSAMQSPSNGGMMPQQQQQPMTMMNGGSGMPGNMMNGGMPAGNMMNGGMPNGMMMMNGGGGGFPMQQQQPNRMMMMNNTMQPQQQANNNMQQMNAMMANMQMQQPQQMQMQQQQLYQQQMMMMQQQRMQQQPSSAAAAAPVVQQPQVPEKEDPFAQFGTNMFRS